VDDDEFLTFACPRCATEVHERFYGPCSACRSQLAAALGGDQRDVAADRFEPAMHVTPNQVATKE
jgi:hypothetical protein